MKKTKKLFAFLLLATIALMFTGCGDDSSPAGFSITTASPLAAGTVGTAYGPVQLVATGGTVPYTWTAPAGTLPAGLTLSADGIISGTPTTAGTVTFTVTATDSANPAKTATKALAITVTAPDALAITTTTLPGATVGTAYSQNVAATGGTGTLTWTITSGSIAPLSLNSTTGTISGTPTAAGTLNFTVTVTDSAATPVTVSQALSITVAAAGVDTTPATFSFTAQTGVALSTVITSNAITVAGINSPAPISITGGTYSINGGTFTSTAGTVTNGQTVTVQHTSSATNSTVTTTTLTIGGVSASFTSTTLAATVNAAALYQAQCSGCHSLGTVDPTGSPNLSGTTGMPSHFPTPGVAGHQGRTLSAAEIAALTAYFLAN